MFKIFLVLVCMTVNYNEVKEVKKTNENRQEITYIESKSFKTHNEAIQFITENEFIRFCKKHDAKLNYIELFEILSDGTKTKEIKKIIELKQPEIDLIPKMISEPDCNK